MGFRRFAPIAVLVALLASTAMPAGAVSNDPARDRQWALPALGADEAWTRGTGAGITIAVVDTGVDLPHEDLAAKIVPGYDFVDDDDDPQDEEGHGTHVAGIAAAITDNGAGVAGVAPGAALMPVRVLGPDGSGSGADVSAGVRWAVDHGAKVINLSLGFPTDGIPLFASSLTDAVRYAWDNGAIAIVAAGNEYVLSSQFGNENVVVVSATDRNDRRPSYSNGVGNAKWGIAAPGGSGTESTRAEDRIFSTVWDPSQANVYSYKSGTSMAAPQVSGAMAVLLGLGLTREQAVERLLSTAVDIGPSGRDSDFGSGRLDLAAATRGLGSGAPTTTAAPATTAPRTTTPPTPGTSPPATTPASQPVPVPTSGSVAGRTDAPEATPSTLDGSASSTPGTAAGNSPDTTVAAAGGPSTPPSTDVAGLASGPVGSPLDPASDSGGAPVLLVIAAGLAVALTGAAATFLLRRRTA